MTDKKKSSNFSAAEVEVLVDEVEMHKSFLFAKFGSNVSNSMKTKLWQDITEKVNAVGVGEVRSIDGVKKKWYDTASKTKKKESCRRREMTATGGGSVGIVLTAEEVKVVEILGDEAVEGISGGFDVGMVGVKAEFKGVMEDEGPSTSRAGTVSLGDGVVVSIQEVSCDYCAHLLEAHMNCCTALDYRPSGGLVLWYDAGLDQRS